ncbi:MAG: hypothetical protein ACI94Y_003851, partial [Maribacter sp.]
FEAKEQKKLKVTNVIKASLFCLGFTSFCSVKNAVQR